MPKRVLLMLAGLLCYLPGSGLLADTMTAQSYLYRIWSVESGLPQISVTAMVQDQQGFIWLGTQNGLVKFDGHQFSVFNTANTGVLSSNLILALHIDRQQRLWVGTANGLFMLENGQFRRLDQASPLQGPVSGFAELSDGTVLVGADRLYRWQQQLLPVPEHQGPVFQLFQQQDQVWVGGQHGFGVLHQQQYQWIAAPEHIAALQLSEIVLLDDTLYLGSNRGLFSWQHGLWSQLPLPGQGADTRIELLYLDPQQQLWITSYDKTYRLDNGQLVPADDILNQDGDFIWVESMLQDQHQNLWLGSRAHGLKRIRKVPTQRFSTAQGIPDPYVWAVQAWQQHMLVGTSKGLALLKDGTYQVLTANQHLPDVLVYSLLQDSQRRLWVGTRAGLSLLDGDTLAWQRNYHSAAPLLVTSLAQEDKRIWVGTNGGLFYVQDDELQQQDVPDILRQARIRRILPDSTGRLWVGTENGLYLRTPEGFAKLEAMPLSDSFITVVMELADGNILVGSFDQGFVLGQPGNWHRFTQHNGLPGNGVLHVEQLGSFLVLSNFQGFYRVDYAGLLQGRVQQLYMLVDDRRPSAATDSHRCCNGAGSSKGAVHQGRLWYPTLDGVISLPLTQLSFHTPVPVPVIESLTAQDQLYSGAAVAVNAAQRDWHFRFTAPFYLQSASMLLRYQLLGYDPDWVEAGNRREAFYTNLPPGSYQFRVQVRHAADYRWSDATSMQVRLLPHWHETLLARGLLLVLLALLLWALYRWRLSALARSQQLLELLVAQRTEQLRQANDKLQQLSMQDALTGLYNRHYVDSNIELILSRSARRDEMLTLVLLDLDHFKSINDQLGHHTGDAVLKQIAQIINYASRRSDHLIRWGGEEFLLILEHDSDIEQLIQRLLHTVRQYQWPQPVLQQIRPTCSVGAVTITAQTDWRYGLELADQALYWVKQHGRDGYLLLQHDGIAPLDQDLGALLRAGVLPVYTDKPQQW